MGTKLSLNYSILSGPYGNAWIKKKINSKPEKLPFESIYLKRISKRSFKKFSKKLQCEQLSGFKYK